VHPSVADSAKSHHGCFSRVQKANGIADGKSNTAQKRATMIAWQCELKFLTIFLTHQ